MRILVIEKKIDVAQFVVKGLRADSFAVDHVADGAEGFRLAQINDYDLLILDTALPAKDGISVCKELRGLGKTYGILFLSGECDVPIKVSALNAGADDYLAAPFSLEELRARIRAILRRERTIIEPVLYIADLVMDTLSHTVSRAGRSIKLSRKEFALLEYFLRNKGRTLTRGMLLEHAWDMNADPFTNTVDVHIRFLREKIDKSFKRKLLLTVHGFGYKIEE